MRSFVLYPSPKQAIVGCVAAMAIALLGIGLRSAAASEPLWLDELHTAWCISGSFDEVFQRATIGNQSPLFFWLAFPLQSRALPFVASLLLYPSIAFLVLRWSGCWLSVCVALLLAALDDSMIYFGVEDRPYATLQLAVVWQVHFFCCHLFLRSDKDAANRLMLCLTSVLLVYLHVTAAVILLAEFLLVMGMPLFHRWLRVTWVDFRWRPSLIVALATAVACVPVLFLAKQIAVDRSDWQVVDEILGLWFLLLAGFLIYVALPVSFHLKNRENVSSENNDGKASEATNVPDRLPSVTRSVLFVSLVSCGVILLVSISGLAPLARLRYAISGYTLLFPLAGLLLAGVRYFRWRIIAAVLVITLAIVTNPQLPALLNGERAPFRSEDWPAVVKILTEDQRPVLLFPNLIEDQRFTNANDPSFDERYQDYYRFPLMGKYKYRFVENRKVFGLPIPRQDSHFELRAEQLSEIQLNGSCFLVVRAKDRDAERLIEEVQLWLQSNLGPVTRRWRKRGILTVAGFELR